MTQAHNMPLGPGKAYRQGIDLFELFEMFPDEASAKAWFEELRWPDGKIECPRCYGERTRPVPNEKPTPFWCADCRQYFSVKTNTSMERSKIPLRKWVIGIYLMTTNLKGVSSMKLHRDLGISQSAAWFMAQRIREGWVTEEHALFEGPLTRHTSAASPEKEVNPSAGEAPTKFLSPASETEPPTR